MRKKYTLSDLSLGIAGIVIGLLCLYGWIANIVYMFQMMADPLTGEFFIRLAGIFFFPLGIIMGYV